jgi:hypothetical protein
LDTNQLSGSLAPSLISTASLQALQQLEFISIHANPKLDASRLPDTVNSLPGLHSLCKASLGSVERPASPRSHPSLVLVGDSDAVSACHNTSSPDSEIVDCYTDHTD